MVKNEMSLDIVHLWQWGDRLNIQRPRAFIVASGLTSQHLDCNMTIAEMKCPKCAGKMAQGFVPDYTHQQALVEGWHEGQPKKSFWIQTKAPRNQGFPIGAFRCEKCGYLELYADPKFAAQ